VAERGASIKPEVVEQTLACGGDPTQAVAPIPCELLAGTCSPST
jgi:hypothetical protein